MKKVLFVVTMMVMVLVFLMPLSSQAQDKCCGKDSTACCSADKKMMKDHPAECEGCKAGKCDHTKMHDHHKKMMKDHPEDCEACKAGTCDFAKMKDHHKEMMKDLPADCKDCVDSTCDLSKVKQTECTKCAPGKCACETKKVDCTKCETGKCACDKKGVKSAMIKDYPADCKSCDSDKCGDMKDADGAMMDMEEGNVWTSADGKKYYKCPVMKGEGLVEEASSFSVIDGVKYYHCCPPCQGPFRKNPDKWLGELFLPGNIEKVEAGVKTYKDPVNGKMGTVEEKTRYFDYDGYRYFFSSKKSLKKFKKDPAQYLG